MAVLYVDARGPYPGLVESWYGEERDATSYNLSLPVVAHPPCAPWSRLARLNRHQKVEHAIHALEVVRRLGGVLEHPASSRLWAYGGMPRPGEPMDEYGGRTIAVEQVRWGHVAVKPTWLYIVGGPDPTTYPVPPHREPTHSCGMRRAYHLKSASAQQRRRTPIAFAEWLLDIASRCSLATPYNLTIRSV